MDTKIIIDPTDWDSLIALMDEYGDSFSSYYGTNEEGETNRISINPDCIVVETYQSNGWVRRNYYHRDYTIEEIFDGKWK